MKLSQPQIATLWIAEGGAPSRADLASSVSMAESGGDTQAGNSCCHGLYQFNVEVGVTSMKCALNAVCATRKAVSMSKNGRDWSAWEAYTNGSYRQFLGGAGHLPRSRAHAKSVLASSPIGEALENAIDPIGSGISAFGGPSIGELGGDLGGALKGIGDVTGLSGLTAIGQFTKQLAELLFTEAGWLRIGKMLGGVILLLWGLRVIIHEGTGTDPVHAGTKLAESAAGAAGTLAVVK